jgi:hypothetical protein
MGRALSALRAPGREGLVLVMALGRPFFPDGFFGGRGFDISAA